MSQSRVLSAFEAVGIVATPRQTLVAAGAFTGVSLARSYLLRRMFDRIGSVPPIPPGGRVKPWQPRQETDRPGLRAHGHICDRGSTR